MSRQSQHTHERTGISSNGQAQFGGMPEVVWISDFGVNWPKLRCLHGCAWCNSPTPLKSHCWAQESGSGGGHYLHFAEAKLPLIRAQDSNHQVSLIGGFKWYDTILCMRCSMAKKRLTLSSGPLEPFLQLPCAKPMLYLNQSSSAEKWQFCLSTLSMIYSSFYLSLPSSSAS